MINFNKYSSVDIVGTSWNGWCMLERWNVGTGKLSAANTFYSQMFTGLAHIRLVFIFSLAGSS